MGGGGWYKNSNKYFRFAQLNTNWRTETLAGLTTFITMAYIIFVNPAILSQTGMPVAAVTAATCLCAAFGSILMGAVANYPLALAPGMGLNAYFTYTVVKGMGVPWQTALGAVFLSGCIFLLLTYAGIRQRLVAAIPHQLHAAVGGGIGLFIAFVGFRNSGIIVSSPTHTVTLGNLRAPETALAIFGLLLIAVLQVLRVRAFMLLGVFGTMLAGLLFHQLHWTSPPPTPSPPSATPPSISTSAAPSTTAPSRSSSSSSSSTSSTTSAPSSPSPNAPTSWPPDHTIPRLNRIFFADATATIVGSLAGTSTVTSYIESSAGVEAGGRTGVTAIVTGLLFFLSLFIAPLIGAIPAYATSPALILVGALMLTGLGKIEWTEPHIAVPSFLTLTMIPLTWSIADGLSFGLTSYALIQIFTGRARKTFRQDWMLYLLATLFLFRFIYLAKG